MKIGKYNIETSNTDKIMFPEAKISKGDLINYYKEISDLIIPHIKSRPLTLKRFPDGIDSKGFFQKKRADYFPDWISSKKLERKEGDKIEMVTVSKKASLVYLANQASIVLHPWLSRADKPEYPDKMIFDLDPPGDDFAQVKKAAKKLRELLENDLDLPVYLMSTGSSGLHVAVPIRRNMKFDEVKDFARKVAALMAERYPDDYTVEIRKNKRKDRIFIDYLRNEYAQTSVAPYSLRALKNAPVAAPLLWDELDDFKGPKSISLQNIFKRMGQKKDPWSDFRKDAQSLKTPATKLKK
jgi:bifunctional non-homologous end joining protein LigD